MFPPGLGAISLALGIGAPRQSASASGRYCLPIPVLVPEPSSRPDTPLWDAYQRDLHDTTRSFAIPGHKRRVDIGGAAVATDRPIGLDCEPDRLNVQAVREAEALAALAYGADKARFSVNGSTAANQAALMAVAGPEDTVAVSRAAHKSVLFGLIYCGATPVWMPSRIDPSTGLPVTTHPDDVAATLGSHPEVTAVLIADPTYVGSVSDIRTIADIVHAADAPLIVDAAWGAHLGWHPALPPCPIAAGADLMVTSAHKTLPSYTQAALLLARGGRIDYHRLDRAFDGTQTTSPAAAILASIDRGRAYMEEHAHATIERLLPAVAQAREDVQQVPGVTVMSGPYCDPMKLVILTSGAGIDGRSVADDLRQHGIDLETANRDMLIPQVTVADTPESIANLTELLTTTLQARATSPQLWSPAPVWSIVPQVACTPREAFFAASEFVPFKAAEGRVSADVLAPYPPGVPVIAPGEMFTTEVLDALQANRSAGIRVAYASDPTLELLRVIT